jgi:hypothetical protein
MRAAWILLTIVAAAGWAAPLKAQPVIVSTIDSSKLVELCNKSSTEILNADFCTGYILGVFDQLSIGRIICVPIGGTGRTYQALAIARKYLNDNPERWQIHPSVLIEAAFQAAFPCK